MYSQCTPNVSTLSFHFERGQCYKFWQYLADVEYWDKKWTSANLNAFCMSELEAIFQPLYEIPAPMLHISPHISDNVSFFKAFQA